MILRKRIGAWTLVLCLLLGMIPTYAGAAEVASGTCGDNLTWVLDDAGTLTISGSGAMTTFSSGGAPWDNNRDSITTAVMESGVTTIGSSAFMDCGQMTSVTIPDSVTSIGSYAFFACNGLTSVTIPDSVTSVGEYAFASCRRLTSVTIPNSVTSIGEAAFYVCQSLTDVYYSGTQAQWATLKGNIGESNASLLNATIHCSDGDIVGGTASDETAASDETEQELIPGDINGDGVVDESDISILTAWINGEESAAGLTEQQQTAADFNQDGQINSRDLAALTQYVRGTQQGYCGADSDGANLTWVLEAGTLTISGTGAMANYEYGGTNTAPWYGYRDSVTAVVMESGVISIGQSAFADCSALTSVTIPDSVTEIGYNAFAFCSGLTGVTIPDSVTSIDGFAFFSCAALTSVTIPNKVAVIGEYAFQLCGLTSVTIPVSVVSIEEGAFRDCSALTDVYYGGTETQWNAVTIGNYNDPLTSTTIHYNSGGGQPVTECHVFFDANGGGDADSMREVTVTPDENGVLRYTLPQCPFTPPENMTFRAWQCTRYDAESKETVTEGVPGDVLDLTGVVSLGLTAQWESVPTQTRTVTFDANGGGGTMTPVTVQDASYTLPECAFTPPDGARFSGVWSVYTANSSEAYREEHHPGETVTLVGDTTVTAVWEIVGESYTITFDRNGGAGEMNPVRGMLFEGSGGGSSSGGGSATPATMNYTLIVQAQVTPSADNATHGTVFLTDSVPTADMTLPENLTSSRKAMFPAVSATSAPTFTGYAVFVPDSGYVLDEVHLYGSGTLDNPVNMTIANGVSVTYCRFAAPGVTNVSTDRDPDVTITGAFKAAATLGGVTADDGAARLMAADEYNCNLIQESDASFRLLYSGEVSPSPLYYVRAFLESSDTGTQTATENGYSVTLDNATYAVTLQQADAVNLYALPQCAFTPPQGMTFKAWRVNNAEYASGATIPISGDMTLTAVWEEDESAIHIIFLAANSASGPIIGTGVDDYYELVAVDNDEIKTLRIKSGASLSFMNGAYTPGAGNDNAENCVILNSATYNANDLMVSGVWVSASGLVAAKGQGIALVNAGQVRVGASDLTLSGSAKAYFVDGGAIERIQVSDIVSDTNDMVYYVTDEGEVSHLFIVNVASDSDILASGYCGGEGDGTNLSYVLTSNGTLTISGSGKMADYSPSNNAPWYDNRESITTGVIESGATSIGNYAFRNCNALKSVTIPDSVTSIGEDAFIACTALTGVTIPDSVTSIGEDAFYGCSGLTGVKISNGLTSIGYSVFYGCSGLTIVTIPNSVTSIGQYAFRYCTGLTSVTIPNSVTSIGLNAFEGCHGLTSVIIPNSVTSIGEGAFWNCGGLTSVTIPNSVTSIGLGAFSYCSKLTSINVASENTRYSSESGVLFNKDKTTLCCYPAGKSEMSYVIPDSVTSIIADAFNGCNGLTSVTIPNSVTSISDWAFSSCKGLTGVTIPDNITTIEDGAFSYCSGLVSVTIPKSVTMIDRLAFRDCSAIKDVYYSGTRAQWNAVTINDEDKANAALHTATIHCTDGDIVNGQSVTSYVVTFTPNGGAGTMNPVTVQGDEYTLPQNGFTPPSRMVFGGWSVNGTEFPPGETISLSENVTVTAIWVNPYRVLDRIQDMDGYSDQTWHLAGPLSEFLQIPSGERLVIDETPLTQSDAFTRSTTVPEYVAEEGSTKLSVPAETFEQFGEGTHSIAATFQTTPDSSDPGDDGRRVTADYYTVKPTGKVTLNADEITGANGVEAAKAVRDVSYTGRFYTNPKLNENYFRMVVTDGTIPAGLTFHESGYFTGTPVVAGQSYTFTVGLQTRHNVTDAWPETYEDTVEVTIAVEQDTTQNVETASDEGYELVERIPATVELSGATVHLTSKGPFEEFTDFYIDGVRQSPNVDYTVKPCLIDPVTGQVIHPLDGGAITGTFIQLSASKLSLGVHSLNLEFVKTDPIGNKQTRNASQKVTVTQKTTPTYVSSGGGGGGSSGPSYYSVKANKPAHGSISLSATSVAAGKTVTVTVTPDSGYRVKSVSAVDSKKVSVKLTNSGNKYTFDMPKRAVTVSATFEPSVYGVSAATAQHGKVTLNVSTAAAGATINGSTTPDKGYLLSGVKVTDASGKSVKTETFNNGKFTFLMPSGKVTVSATFAVKRLASFVDIQGPDWFFDDAEWAYHKNILRGTTEQYWEPQSLMSSVTSIVTLERLDGVDLTPYDTGADDGIDNSHWYASAQRWARDNNILLKDRPFGEREAMTRGECAVMLTNYLRYRGLNVTPTSETTFTDAAELTLDELSAFRLLQDADVFRGYGDGTIRPKAYLSRAHLSALLHRLSEYIIQVETAGV